MKRPFYLSMRGNYWYYRLNKESGIIEQDDLQWRTTGCADRDAAERFVANLIDSTPQIDLPTRSQTFRQYASPFFIWEECPHIRRVFEETGRYTEQHARIPSCSFLAYIPTSSAAPKMLT